MLMLAWTELLDYFIDHASNKDLRELRDGRIRERYLKTTMGRLMELQGGFRISFKILRHNQSSIL